MAEYEKDEMTLTQSKLQPYNEQEAKLQQWLDDEYLWEQFNNLPMEVSDMWPAVIKDERKQAPAGYVLFAIESVERVNKITKSGEKAVEQVNMSVVLPEAYEGTPHQEIFWLGTDQDPKAEKPETLERGGASKFKTFASAIDVNIEGQDEDLVRSMLKDQRILGQVSHKVSADGFVNARVNVWMKEGEKEPMADEDAIKAAREQANAIQTSGGAQRGQGALPGRFAGNGQRASAPLPPARPTAPMGPRVTGR